jgi:glycosyltransferase involved in cell wall biosynthesis
MHGLAETASRATGVSKRPGKLLFVTTDLAVGGAEAALTRLVTAPARLADEIVVASLLPAQAYAARLRDAGIRVIEFNFGTKFGAVADLIGLARLIRAERPDVVQGWMYHGDLAALLALRMSGRRKQTRLIWGIRCSQLDFSRYRPAIRFVVRACALLSYQPDVITANSAAGMKAHLDLGYKPRRSEIIANGVDLNEFKPDPRARAEMRARLGIDGDATVVAHVARVDPMKDHATFVTAMTALHDVRALIVGAGTERLKVPENVLRLGNRDNVPALFAGADFVVSSSAFGEGFPNVIAEGMACGLPPVATDVGDARAIIGDTGIVVPPHDPAALAAAIRTLAAEPRERRAERGRKARERIAERYPLERAVARFAALYETVG